MDPRAICGCCEGLGVETPEEPFNPPGLSDIAYRSGDWASFRRSLLARLSSSGAGPLASLTTRQEDDFTIALLDAWAVTGDVLTFYQERLFEEGKLRTAEDLRSLHHLARLVGWRPSPGVAAAADLAFSMDETGPRRTTLAVGIKVQSTPGPNEEPAIYETVAEIEARPRWNGLRPRLSRAQALSGTVTRLWLPGADVRVREGDGVFFRGPEGPVFAVVRGVERQTANLALEADARTLTAIDITRVGSAPEYDSGDTVASVSIAPPPPADAYYGSVLDSAELRSMIETNGHDEETVFAPFEGSQQTAPKIALFHLRASMFGHNAPPFDSLPAALTGEVPVYGTDDEGRIVIDHLEDGPYKDQAGQWADGDLNVLEEGTGTIHLQAVHPEIATNDVIVLRDGAQWGLYRVNDAAEASYSRFTISAKATRLELDSDSGFGSLSIRGTTAFGDVEWLSLAPEPILDSVTDASLAPLELEGWAPGLEPGRKVAVTGRPVAGGRKTVAEIVAIASVEHDMSYGGGTRITVSPALSTSYVRGSVRINANVAPATHGEGVFEILGTGDGTKPFQTFTAQQHPQTHVSSENPSGYEPTLDLRVNDVLWQQVPHFLDRRPDERIYVARIDDEGRTHVRFGDGRTGARLTTGAEIRAKYRKGLGLAGRVRAGQLNMPMSRPLGLKGAINPLASSGGADPDSPEDIRESAPLPLRALERAVSMRDYEDLALGFAGVAKAHAVMYAEGAERRILVTVAGEEGEAIAEGSDLHKKLANALTGAGDPYARFVVRSYRPALFQLALRVKIDGDYLAEKVLAALEAALRAAFSFEARGFAQPVWLSEVMSVCHTAEGVLAVDVDKLYRGLLPDGTPASAGLKRGVESEPPRRGIGGQWLGAEILTLHPGPFDLLETMS